MTNFDELYIKMAKRILDKGYCDNNRTGMPSYKIPHQIMQFDLEEEFPILTSKFVAFKTAVKEILWIMQKQSNNINDLDGHIWDEWADKDGSIGKAYGYQIKKYHQIDRLIESLINNPQDRRMMINIWNWEDLPEMNLAPCCFLSLWDVTDGRLNCMLIQRSGDVPLGVPFNTTQYAVLTHLIAQVTGLKPGLLTHVINNAHIYTNQIEGMHMQFANCSKQLEAYFDYDKFSKTYPDIEEKDYKKINEINNCKPTLKINREIKNFYDFTIDDIELEDYKHMGKIPMPVSV